MIPVDDLAERCILIGVHLLVRDTERLLVRQICGGVLDEQLENVIGLVGGSGDGTEHPNPGRRRGEHLQHTERDGRLPGVPFR